MCKLNAWKEENCENVTRNRASVYTVHNIIGKNPHRQTAWTAIMRQKAPFFAQNMKKAPFLLFFLPRRCVYLCMLRNRMYHHVKEAFV